MLGMLMAFSHRNARDAQVTARPKHKVQSGGRPVLEAVE
jgi:hypothetical protein